MVKRETHLDRLARLTYDAVTDIRERMATKEDLNDLGRALTSLAETMHQEFKELRELIKETSAAQTHAIVQHGDYERRLARLEKRIGLAK